MPNPLNRAMAIASKVVGELPVGKVLPPPPPPPPAPARAFHQAEEPAANSRLDEVLAAVQRAISKQPVPEGHSRLYRYGPVPADASGDGTRTVFGKTYTPEEWDKYLASKGIRNTEPTGARGRWFTDVPEELDYYVKDAAFPKPLYAVDVPSARLPDINVSRTPYSESSSNHAREFVVPDEYLTQARRLLEGRQ